MLLVTKAHHSSQVSPKKGGLGFGSGATDTTGRRAPLSTDGFTLLLSLTVLSVGSGAAVCWPQGWQAGRGSPLASYPCVQEMSSEYREYADSFGKVSTAWLAAAARRHS